MYILIKNIVHTDNIDVFTYYDQLMIDLPLILKIDIMNTNITQSEKIIIKIELMCFSNGICFTKKKHIKLDYFNDLHNKVYNKKPIYTTKIFDASIEMINLTFIMDNCNNLQYNLLKLSVLLKSFFDNTFIKKIKLLLLIIKRFNNFFNNRFNNGHIKILLGYIDIHSYRNKFIEIYKVFYNNICDRCYIDNIYSIL